MKDAINPTKPQAPASACGLQALAEAACSANGHFDELRGRAAAASTSTAGESGPLGAAWQQFISLLGDQGAADLDLRAAGLARQIRDNGITYNVYADENGPQRPWSLDLFPLIIGPADWQRIEAGVLQRMHLLEGVMADVYGPQQLLAKGMLPPALVQGHPGYLRAMHGARPAGGNYLHIAAFDLARGPDGNWWVVSQRCQAPSGLGYLLENRLAISGRFPQAFQAMKVQRLAGTYRALMDSLKQMSPAGQDSHIALLTPGPYNETYFEHVYLARYLGLTLVEGNDLIVRDEHLYLKTLKGLVPVHGLLKRVDDQFLDPLELRPDSTLGVPGLLQAVRAGNLLLANAPGTAFLESPALMGFLPALSRHLLGQELLLPALPTWWCGERLAMQEALPQLAECAIKPTYPAASGHEGFDAVLGQSLSARELDEWAGRIVRQGDEHTLQAYMPLSQMPIWRTGGPQSQTGGEGVVALRSVMLRVFAVSNGTQAWQLLPGGLARLVSAEEEIASMQRGGSSADVWALTNGEVDSTTLLKPRLTPSTVAQHTWLVTSRAAENLYWMGRYSERSENAARLARLTLECLGGEDQSSAPLLQWLSQMAVDNTLVLPTVPSALHGRRIFERSLISSLGSTTGATSVGYNLRALRLTGATVRDRLSQEHWRMIVRAEEDLFRHCVDITEGGDYSAPDALRVLKATSDHLAAITGAQTDRMTRDDGWRLLSIGRHLERLGFLSKALARAFETGAVHTVGGFEALISLFDSTITFHAQYQQSRDVAPLIELLVLNRENPRSLAWVAQTLRGRLAKLGGGGQDQLTELALRVPDPGAMQLGALCESFDPVELPPAEGAAGVPPEPVLRHHATLDKLLVSCMDAAFNVSEDISAAYFTHSGQSNPRQGA